MALDRGLLRRILLWIAVGALAYFGNVQVQSWLGRRALDATGLQAHSLEAGLILAGEQQKLVLADLSAIWCGSCRRFDEQVLGDEEVGGLIGSAFVFVRVEYESDEGKAFRSRYQVKGFPNLLVLDARSNLIERLPTTFDPRVFAGRLRQVLRSNSGAGNGGATR